MFGMGTLGSILVGLGLIALGMLIILPVKRLSEKELEELKEKKDK